MKASNIKVWLFISMAFGMFLMGYGQSSLKPALNVNNQKQYISFDSINFRYKAGDKIVINDWILMGPKDFFDSVSIDKNLFKAVLIAKDSAVSQYGSFGTAHKFYELKIPNLDSLPRGDFIDKKLYKYFYPDVGYFYFIDGGPCSSFSNALFLITNKKNREINELSPESAKAIWGDNYGKNGAIIINTVDKSEAQKLFRPFSSTSVCRDLVLIDSIAYFKNEQPFKSFDKPSTIKKVKGVINVPFNKSVLIFRDDTSIDSIIEYSVAGQNLKNNWILIKAEYYNKDYYYLINQKLNKIDTLIGAPMIFGNRIICQEGSDTDGKEFLEVWNLQNRDLQRVKKFSLIPCGIFVDDLYLKDNTLFLKCNLNKYLKMKIN